MKSKHDLTIIERPALRQPDVVCALGGWVDGGEAGTGTVRYLVQKLGARKFAEIAFASFHTYQAAQTSLRPYIRVEDGILKEHRFPQNEFYYYFNVNGGRDLILFSGAEPNLGWEEYADAILSLTQQFSPGRIYILGGILDKTPHTKEPNVLCLCSSSSLKAEMQKYAMQFTNYEGPGSFGTMLMHACQVKNIDAVSMVARATFYPEFDILTARNPKSIRGLVRRLNILLSLRLDISDLDAQTKEFEEKFEFMSAHNPLLRAYVKELEKEFVEVEYDEPLDLSGDEGVRIAEELLKKNKAD